MRCTGEDAVLSNTVGGPDAARYSKHKHINWREDMLSHAIDTAERWLSNSSACTRSNPDTSDTVQKIPLSYPQKVPVRMPCLDVIIPSYRCDPSMLRALTSLQTSAVVSLNTIVVVDRPDAPTLPEIKALESYAVDRVVCSKATP
jgi:hypothetical protein